MQNPNYKSTLTTRALGPNLMLIHLAKYARKLVRSKDENRLRFKDQTMNTEIALRPFTIFSQKENTYSDSGQLGREYQGWKALNLHDFCPAKA